MSSSNRADVLKRLYAELKKKYSAVSATERTVLEHFLYATCLEDATYEAANAVFSALVETMSGWNEVRVSSVTELSELMPQLPDPRGTAIKLRKILHAVFEERYCFDIDDIRKKSLKEAYEKLESIPGGTPFSINYTAQIALGRHGIPVGNGEKRLLYVLGIISEKDIEEREVGGLNRAISKSQGMEFASLLHQLAAAFVQNPEARKIVSFLKSFAPDFRVRMPKRREIRVENTMETPEPIVTHEVAPQNMMDLLINDPDFRKERENDRFEDTYDDSEERAKEEYLEEMAMKRRKNRSSKEERARKIDCPFEEDEEIEEKKTDKTMKSQSASSENQKEKTSRKNKKVADKASKSSEKVTEKRKEKAPKAENKDSVEKGKKAENSTKAEKGKNVKKVPKAKKLPKTEKEGKTPKKSSK